MSPPAGLRERVPLAPFTTLGIGGPARWLVEADGEEQLAAALAWAGQRGVPLFVLGGGSNLLVADEGYPGLVLRVALRGVSWEAGDGDVTLRAAAGEPWDPLVAAAVERGLAGLECLSGIPGSAGATPIQNVGAYGQEVAETVASVEALSRADGTRRHFTAGECGFAYRDSVWKRAERDCWVIAAVSYRLGAGGAPAVRYPELQRHLEDSGDGAPDLARVREAVLALRRRKGMVLDAGDPDTRSDGSFFVNPVIAAAELPAFLARVAETGIAAENMPRYPAAGGGVKLSAAWLIERAGFAKGHRHGGVGISSKHALALINRGGGTAREMVELVREIRRRVADRFGVLLVPEPSFVGFEGDPLAAP
ncbi:MAG TPA: UDP-N-acetylmuramate dehydrogenase [Thermoanaerobaculia bacterium]|jgi:UDP-N-acetylmuramate dehydrogenase|nr:UDP-N-acetylmuramate dehydrogenase [Thermoanaerobaculia bacterium]